jgi:GTP diphosphokinase / guanosine-3',5'-bis(diphosphate) 3'-diphosphatase
MERASSLLSFLPGGRRSPGIAQLITKVEGYLPAQHVERIQEAYELAHNAHREQKRFTGEPYITHPVAVAALLADLHLDMQTICAALLHDVIEDTPTAKDEIVDRFGREVGELVDGVSKLDKVQFKSRKEAQAESFRKMILAMTKDIRIILVKLSDRTHNMRTLSTMPPEKRRRIATETLEIYAPIANRLGINSMKLELEDLGFQNLYPHRYQVLDRELKRAHGNQKEFLPKIVEKISNAFQAVQLKAAVDSREKHLFSVYQKMRRKRLPLAQIIDVFGIRILVDSIDQCYRALGLVHSLYKPMPGRFKDYIAIPRLNGYQSLHTTLFGPNGIPLEVQIRTKEMHQVAESGIAAHWRYKTGDKEGGGHERAREWLSGLMQIQENGNSEEFIESVKLDLFPDKVYVFTPQGDILRLPRGATCVDFAYAVHTDVGKRCVAAKIDRRLVPLRTEVRNGQTVEIITAAGATPNPAWASFVVTAKARASIRNLLKDMHQSDAVEMGQRLLQQALMEFSISLKKVKRARLQALAQELGFDAIDELYAKIGLGERLAPLVARHLLPTADTAAAKRSESGAREALPIAGTEGLVVTYAQCCYPIPGDPILGFLAQGRGVEIHRASCAKVEDWHKNADKWLPVTWNEAPGTRFTTELQVQIPNRPGALAAIASAIANADANIGQASVAEQDSDTTLITVAVQVHNRVHLAKVIRSIRSVPEALTLTRS